MLLHQHPRQKQPIKIHHHTTVTLASTSNALPDYGVTAPKHVGAVLM
jgi:hypothetical protein